MNSQTQSTSRKQRKERIPLRVIKGGLVPADKYAESTLRNKKYQIGDIVFGVITKPRNPKFNRLVHKLGILCAENIEAFNGMEAHTVIKRLQIEGRIACDEIGIMIPGFGMASQFVPRSLSFDSMDEAEFHEAAKAICRHIADRYWPDLTPERIRNMAECMVDE